MPWNVPDGTLLDAGASQYAPFAAGRPPIPVTGLEGTPFQNMGLMGSLIGGPIMSHFMGGAGLTPLGVTDQNVMDLMRRQQFSQLHMKAIQEAAVADRENYIRTMRGVAYAAGVPFGPDQRAAAGAAADMMVKAAPFAALFAPELLDQLGGYRGSAAVLASRIAQGGRYRTDPVTGTLGLSAASVSHFAQSLYHDVYEAGDVASLGGMTAGQFGSMYDEMQRRGMVAASGRIGRAGARGLLGQMSQGETSELFKAHGINAPADISQLGLEDLDKLSADPQISDKLRRFDVSAVKRSVESYVKAVGAVRDIFGDLGRSDAPMAQLMASLEQLTGGSLSQLDPGRLAMMVRQTHELTRMGGVSIDNAILLQQHAMARATGLGIEPMFGVQAMQGSLAFGNAYRQAGLGAVPAWGLASPEALQQLDANLRVNAAGSALANRYGVLDRVNKAAGGFDKNSEAAALVRALDMGEQQYEFNGQTISTGIGQSDLIRILGDAKDSQGRKLPLSEGGIRELLEQTATNRQYTFENGRADYVRMIQGKVDFLGPSGFLTRTVQDSLSSQLRGLGIGNKDASEAVTAIRDGLMQKIVGMSEADMADSGKRDSIFGKAIQEALEASAPGVAAKLKADGKWDTFAPLVSDQFFGYANKVTQEQLPGFGSFVNLHRMSLNPTTLRAGQQQQLHAKLLSMQAEAYMPLGGHGSLLRNFVNALQATNSPRDQNTLTEIIGKTLGGRDLRAMGPDMLKLSGDVAALGQDAEAKLKAWETAPDEATKKVKYQEYLDANQKLSDGVKDFANKLAAQGLTFDRDLPVGDIAASLRDADYIGKQRGAGAPGDWGAYWKSDAGQGFRRSTHYFQQDAMRLSEQALESDSVMRKLGPDGLKHVQAIRSAGKDLSELSLLYAGGDMSRLLRGDLRPDLKAGVADEVRDKVTKLLADERGGLEAIQSAMGQSGKGAEMSEDYKKKVKAYRESELQTSEVLLRRVLKAHGLESTKDTDSLRRALGVGMSMEGRDRLSVLADSSEALEKIAGGGDKLGKLLQDYSKAETEDKLSGFFSQYGIAAGDQEMVKRQVAFLRATTMKGGAQFHTEAAEDLMKSLNANVDLLGGDKEITAVVKPGTKFLLEGHMTQDGSTTIDATAVGNEGQLPTDAAAGIDTLRSLPPGTTHRPWK